MISYCQQNIGYFIEYKNLFSTWLLPDTTFNASDLNVALGAFDRLLNPDFSNVYKGIFKTLQSGLQKLGENPAAQTKALKELIKLIKDIPTDGKQDYDVLGYVYEYLISNFAANAGKKAGEFYTPHEVAQVMSEIVAEHHKDKENIQIYDPTSGSGSLLITIGKSVGKHMADTDHVKYYAQELKENTYNLTRMNLVMRGIKPSNIETRCADSLDEDWPLEDPQSGRLEPLRVDAVVSNPPYSQPWDPSDAAMDARFKDYGVAPKSKADYAFLLHELHHLDANGIMTIVLPHGVLFRGDPEDGAEGAIRRNLIEKNHIDTIIGLPANIFFGTGIPTLIMVVKQHRSTDDVLFIDASKGFIKEGKSNKLRACDIKKIADTVRDRSEEEGYSCRISRDEIRKNGYNLNIPRYVDSIEDAEKYDIYATMFGGIPNSEIDSLKHWWNALPSLKSDLFEPEFEKPYSSIKVSNISSTIEANPDAISFGNEFKLVFNGFAQSLRTKLIDNIEIVNELSAMEEISDNIFNRMHKIPLIDKYDAYQILADNWSVISNDIEVIKTEGIDSCRIVEEAKKIKKSKDGTEEEVPDGLKGKIIPFELYQKKYLSDELNALESIKNARNDSASSLEDIISSLDAEEQEKLLNDDNTKFDKASLTEAWCEIIDSADTPEINILRGYLTLSKKKEKKDYVLTHSASFWSTMETKEYGIYSKSVVVNEIKQLASSIEFISDSYEDKVKRAAEMTTLMSALDKKIKEDENSLISKTTEGISRLTDEQIKTLLEMKWIDPIYEGVSDLPRLYLEKLEKDINSLAKKYEIPLRSLEQQIGASEEELSVLVKELTGNDYDIAGLKELIKGGK